MRKINYQALRDAAEKATQGEWVAFISPGKYGTYAVHTPGDNHHGDIVDWPGFDGQKNAENNARYIAAFNPEVVQALLDELERNQQYIKSRDQENEDIALTVGKLRVELEGKDSKIANLTAERDALREGEMGDARHSNTRAAADIYFQLVEECEIPAGGSLVEYVDDMREKLEAAEKRIAELEARAFNPAILDVIAERQRQQSVEGWMPEHDDEHCNGELAMAAVCYINETGTVNRNGGKPWGWPWDASWWKPNARRRNLVKAGALILAEIERIDRAAGIGKGE